MGHAENNRMRRHGRLFRIRRAAGQPRPQGQAIAVTGAGERTVVTTSSYEARAYGVKTGMTVYEAKRLCPDIILVVGNNEKYAEACADSRRSVSGSRPDTECTPSTRSSSISPARTTFSAVPENLARALKDRGKKRAGHHLHGRHRPECPYRQARERPRKARRLTLDERGDVPVRFRGPSGEEALGHRVRIPKRSCGPWASPRAAHWEGRPCPS